jgi:hypothetical protein
VIAESNCIAPFVGLVSLGSFGSHKNGVAAKVGMSIKAGYRVTA